MEFVPIIGGDAARPSATDPPPPEDVHTRLPLEDVRLQDPEHATPTAADSPAFQQQPGAPPVAFGRHERKEDDGMNIDKIEGDLSPEEQEEDLRMLLGLHAAQDRQRAAENHRDMISLLTALGQSGAKYRREATRRLKAIVSEVYSAPRVTAMAKRRSRLGIIPGLALDLTVNDELGKPWDFNDPAQRS